MYTSSQDRIARGEEDVTASISCITGCRTTSKFVDIGNQTAWKAVDGRSVERLSTLVKKAILMLKYINKERAAVFQKTTKMLDSLPPTQDALQLHLQRVNHQVLIWKMAKQPCNPLPTLEGNGWLYDEEGVLKPKVMTQEDSTCSMFGIDVLQLYT